MTSIAVQPATAMGTSSDGRMPRSPAPSSSTMVWPLPDVAEKWTPSPWKLRTAVLVAMIDSDAVTGTVARGERGGHRHQAPVSPGPRGRCRRAGHPALDDAMDDVARLDDRGLGEAVGDGRAGTAADDEARGAHHREVLAGVRQRHADGVREGADRAVPVPKGIEDHQALGVGEHLAHLRMEAEALEGVGVDLGHVRMIVILG